MAWNESRLMELRHSVDELSHDISQGKLPAPLLKDFKLSVDQLRLTLWAIMSFETQVQKGASSGLGAKLFEFRVKRLIQMLSDFQSDLKGSTVIPNPSDITSLTETLHATLQTLAQFKLRKA